MFHSISQFMCVKNKNKGLKKKEYICPCHIKVLMLGVGFF